MKKIIFALMLVFLLVGCGGNTTTTNKTTDSTQTETTTKAPVSFKVITPAGSPALAQTYLQKTEPSLGENISYETEVVADATKLAAAFGSKSHEFIYAPMNMGAKFYNAAGNYLLAATVVFGNNYIITGDSSIQEFNLEALNGKDIILFGENNVPAIVTEEVLKYNNIKVKSITYKASTNDTKNEIILDSNKIVLVAEPSLSALRMALKDKTIRQINLQDEWKKMTSNDSYAQAGIFVKKDFATNNHDVVVSYINEVKKSIEYTNTHVDEVAKMAVELEYGFPLPVLKTAIPNSNLLFKSAKDSKASIEFLFNKIIDSNNGALVGGKLPNEGFYFE